MSWPTNTDYAEAIQMPELCFADTELKHSVVELNRLGLPKPYSGNFATVYKVEAAKRTWAVRCFLRDFADQRFRYQAIDAEIRAKKLPSAVGFQFIEQGILIRGKWHPILKMEWVQGDLLHRHVEQTLDASNHCSSLALRWIELCRSLRGAGIAHGDLQHGNIVVVNGDFKLIDYDGMYVPALRGRDSHEVGHPNYQHPQRKPQHFGPWLDNFSAWIVYASLIAISIDPSLWRVLNAGDECLLFRKEDFENPDISLTFRSLMRHSDHRIRALAEKVRSLMAQPPESIPPLDGLQEAPTGEWLKDHTTRKDVSTRKNTTAPLPDWIAESMRTQTIPSSSSNSDSVRALARALEAEGVAPPPMPDWLAESIRNQTTPSPPATGASALARNVATEGVTPGLPDWVAESLMRRRTPSQAVNVRSVRNLSRGMVLEGVVTGIQPYGYFVDIGVEWNGLVHISEIVTPGDPKDCIRVGERLRVKVLKVNQARERIHLSLKQVA